MFYLINFSKYLLSRSRFQDALNSAISSVNSANMSVIFWHGLFTFRACHLEQNRNDKRHKDAWKWEKKSKMLKRENTCSWHVETGKRARFKNDEQLEERALFEGEQTLEKWRARVWIPHQITKDEKGLFNHGQLRWVFSNRAVKVGKHLFVINWLQLPYLQVHLAIYRVQLFLRI